MKCPNCNFEVAENTKFCPECGTKLQNKTDSLTKNVMKSDSIENDVQSISETKDSLKKIKKGKKHKGKKIIKFATIVLCSIVLILVFVCHITYLVIPKIKYDKAIKMMEEGKYVDAVYELRNLCGYKVFDKNEYKECTEKAIDKLIAEEKYEEVVKLLLDHSLSCNNYNGSTYGVIRLLEKGEITYAADISAHSYTDKTIVFESFAIKDSKEEKHIFDGISEYLDALVLSAEYGGTGYFFGYYDDVSNKKLEFISLLLMEFPTNNQEAWRLKMLCDGLSSHAADEFIDDNWGLIEDFWHYGMVRRAAYDMMNLYLEGEWKSSDKSYWLSLEGGGFFLDNANVFYNLPHPSIPHKSFQFDYKNKTLIYTNSGGVKVCDVFKFELDKQDPRKLHVYCYENGETITLLREHH